MNKLVLTILLVILSVLNCSAQDKVVTAACDRWPPFVDSSAQGGLSIEIIEAAYATQGYTVKMNYVPWARAENGVKNGKHDILPPTWITEKRKAHFMFSDSYAVNNLKFIKSVDDSFEYDCLKSLAGKTIGVVRGYGYNDEFLKATTFEKDEVKNFITNVKKLTNPTKRIDLTLEDEIVARAIIMKESPELLKQIRFTKTPLSSNNLHVASGITNPRHKEVIEAFNKGLAIIKENGELAKIMDRYGM